MMAARVLSGQVVCGRQSISIQRLLEWAFGSECAQVEFEGELFGVGYGSISNAGRMADRGALGCRIEGGGRSLPADDAEIVASYVAALPEGCGGKAMALRVAELARAGRSEDSMADVVPRCEPAAWHRNRHGLHAKSEHVCYVEDRSGRKVRQFDSRVCPVTYTPGPSEIGRARRKYLAWRGALLDVRSRLIANGNLESWALTDVLPPATPWKKVLDG